MPEDFAGGLDAESEAFVVDVGGFEGPLDVLLALARTQKVDLRKVSILQLAERYLAFITEAHRLRIELAADYLVMASWLAFLKSRLLLPPPHEDGGPSGEELARMLAERLARLEAIRDVASRLMARDRLGAHVFARGEPETTKIDRTAHWMVNVADLLKAYGALRTREAYQPLHVRRAPAMALEDALKRLRAMLGETPGWAELSRFLPPEWADTPERRRSALASSFAATLELAKRGEVALRQENAFAPLMVSARRES